MIEIETFSFDYIPIDYKKEFDSHNFPETIRWNNGNVHRCLDCNLCIWEDNDYSKFCVTIDNVDQLQMYSCNEVMIKKLLE